MTAPRTLRLVLGDQLSAGLAGLRDLDPDRDLVLMAEVHDEATYVRHHKQKIALVFAAMRTFARDLEARGARVRYVRIDDSDNSGLIVGELLRALSAEVFDRVVITECGEWRLAQALEAFVATVPVPATVLEDDRFVCAHAEFRRWATDRRVLRMEDFYRVMRRRTGLLMDGQEPVGGQWNFDVENRRSPPRDLRLPPRARPAPDAVAREAIADVARLFPDHFGTLDAFAWPTSAAQAEEALKTFIDHVLPGFGDWQDAMLEGEPWMWHALISTSLNLGLLDPLETCRRAEGAWISGKAPLNAVEGFIRQILGWREFVRGVYWLKVPEYRARNALEADRALPWFYWSGETDMRCVADAVASSRTHAYAHHIQRLMVTGNLAMMLGVAPDAVDDWYMTVYADAFEWVEMPNTRGMATFADGGVVGSKPYAASGAYINRMSRYCGGCRYDVKAREGDGACPFNRLYWGFLESHRDRLSGLHRLAMPYRTLDGFGDDRRRRILEEYERTRLALGAVPVATTEAL
ncbi:cryptochrome/photolyase family protein [Brevundimonas sp. FT23028]|uniref:cryptochrome/photolyase family protein n=1 Tax=Brevundimonas sp. FT23028 TaxID=3393748 RepID=UPI003B587714